MFTFRRTLLASLFVGVVACVPFVPQTTSATSVDPEILTIDGVVPKPQKLTAADLAKLPRRSVQIKAADGSVSTYEGPILADVLALAGVVFGPELKGPALANYVVVTGADKFRVVFALPELDSSFTDRVILLADKRDGKPLSAAEGPLRSIVPDEKRRSRWVNQVVSLTVLSAPAALQPSKVTGRRKHD